MIPKNKFTKDLYQFFLKIVSVYVGMSNWKKEKF